MELLDSRRYGAVSRAARTRRISPSRWRSGRTQEKKLEIQVGSGVCMYIYIYIIYIYIVNVARCLQYKVGSYRYVVDRWTQRGIT